MTVRLAGLQAGVKVLLLGSKRGEVEAVRASHDMPGMAGFDHELGVLASRARRGGAQEIKPPKGMLHLASSARYSLWRVYGLSAYPATLTAGSYTFKQFEVWQQEQLVPRPKEALKLLYRLAADPGIRGIMKKHRWDVQRLSEMPPEGKVGVSPVCILGVNIGAGQEISLRLRTDDLKVSSQLDWKWTRFAYIMYQLWRV